MVHHGAYVRHQYMLYLAHQNSLCWLLAPCGGGAECIIAGAPCKEVKWAWSYKSKRWNLSCLKMLNQQQNLWIRDSFGAFQLQVVCDQWWPISIIIYLWFHISISHRSYNRCGSLIGNPDLGLCDISLSSGGDLLPTSEKAADNVWLLEMHRAQGGGEIWIDDSSNLKDS